MSAAKLNATKRFAVRMSLVTGSTLATIIGAQSLAMLDEQTFSALITPEAAQVEPALANPAPADTFTLQNGVPTATNAASGLLATTTPQATATANPMPVAPNIAILRRPGQVAPVTAQPTAAPAQAVQSAPVQIAPPAPVQIAPPAPVVVQAAPAPAAVAQPAAPAPAPVTRSSRR